MQKMNNKKGVKLLAAIMAFAMVFVAGFAIIASSDDADAAAAPTAGSDISSFTSSIPETGIVKDGKYKVSTTDTIINIADGQSITGNVKILMKSGISITINGKTGNKLTIDVYTTGSSDLSTYYTNDSKITITEMTSGSVTITSTGGNGTTTASTFTIKGDATVASGGSITATPALATGDGNYGAAGIISVTTDGLKVAGASTASAGIKAGIITTDAETKTVRYYCDGSNVDSFILTTTDVVNVYNGSIKVSQGTDDANTIQMTSVVSSAGITVTATPAIYGSYSAGTITVTKGTFTAYDGSSTGLTVAGTAVLNAFSSDAVANSATMKISATVAGLGDISTGGLWVYGTVAGNQTVTIDPTSSENITIVKAEVTSLTIEITYLGTKYQWMISVNGTATFATPATPTDASTITLSSITTAADITFVNGKFDTTMYQVTLGSSITVSENAKYTIDSAGNSGGPAADTTNLYGKMNIYGELAGTSQIISVACVASGSPGEFRAYEGSKINGVSISLGTTNTIKGIIEIATGTAIVKGEIRDDANYGQTQNVVVEDYYDIKNNADVTILGSFEVPEGTTVTIYAGSSITINGYTSVVKIAGKIIVEKDASFTVSNSKNVEVTGIIESEGSLTFNGGTFEIKDGGFVNSQGSFAGSYATVKSGSELRLNGETSTTAFTIKNSGTIILEEVALGHNVTIKNASDGAVVKIVSYTAGSGKTVVIDDSELTKYNNVNVTSGDNSVTTTHNFTGANIGYSGITVTTSVVLVGNNNTPVKKMDVQGSFDIYKPSSSTTTISSSNILIDGPNTTVTEKITLGENVKITAGTDGTDLLTVSGSIISNETGSVVVATGKITVTGEIIVKGTTAIGTADNVNAAYYKEKTTDDITFQHYTTLAKAIKAGATDIKTYGTITVLDNVDVPAGTTIDNNGTIVIGSDKARSVIVTFANGATLKGANSVTVNGTLDFANKKDNRITSITSDVSVIGDVASKYTNIYTALGSASEGDVVTITKQTAVEIDSDITVKAGVTLSVPAGKSVTVKDNVTVTVDGTIISYSGLAAQHAFAVKEESEKSALVVNGKFLTGEASTDTSSIYGKYSTPGAYYVITGATGTYTYIAPVTVAVADAQDAGTLHIYGENKFTSVKVDATQTKPVVIDMTNGSKVQGDIELSTYASVDNNGATYDGTIKSAVGEVKLTNTKNFKITATIDAEKNEYLNVFETPVKAAGTATNKFVIVSGTVTAPGTTTNSNQFDADAAGLSISSDATLKVTGEAEVTDMKVDGTLVVANGQTGGKLTVTGYLQVNGTFIVEEADASKSLLAGSATIPTLYVGISKSAATTGATASVSAPAISGLTTAYIAAGATVSEKILDAVKNLGKSTVFTVDGADYMTVYTSGNILVSSIAYPALEGAKVTKWQYADSTGKLVDASAKKIGEIKAASALIDTNVYKINIVVDSAITDVYLDGELLASAGGISKGGVDALVSAGTHQITYKLKAGYGGDIKVTFNGQTATDGKFTISKDMDFQDADGKTIVYKVTISGAVLEPIEPTPVEKDDGMGITDYLLIVLVILAAILVVVVAIRMMRS